MPILKVISSPSKKFCSRLQLIPYIIALCLFVSIPHLHGQTPTREYQLKAVFLFNFTQFVDWPAHSFETDRSPLVIGVLGENPFGSFLEQTVSEEKINGHPVIVQYYKTEKEIKSCHILFINVHDKENLRQVLEDLKGKNILTVSETTDFSSQGGMIRFITSNNKIKLQINIEACRESDLLLSSKLLRLAEIYKPQEKS